MEKIIDHFTNLMPQLGYKTFTWEMQTIVLNEQMPTNILYYQNEYLYLLPQSVIEGMELFADNDFLKTDAITTAEPKSLIKPFTGNIHITIPPNTRQVLFFIQVIPQI